MPLRALTTEGQVQSFELDSHAWDRLKSEYKALGLRMPCCDSAAVPKTSKLGMFFFAHKYKGECKTAPESAEHIYCKHIVARAAMAQGWTVSTEWPGATPDGEEWVADVFCQKGQVKLALEIQLSRQTPEETRARQAKYKSSGVRAAWFCSEKSYSRSLRDDRETPAFLMMPFTVGAQPIVERFSVPVHDFVVGMLSGSLKWDVPERVVHIEYLDDVCWSCKRGVKQVFGHVVHNGWEECEEDYHGWHERHFTPHQISAALLEVRCLFSDEELSSYGLNKLEEVRSVKGKPTTPFMRNKCIHCGAPQNNWHIARQIESREAGRTGLLITDRTYKGAGLWLFANGLEHAMS